MLWKVRPTPRRDELERRHAGDVLTAEFDVTRRWLDLTEDAVEERGLARAIGPITPTICPGATDMLTPSTP
jgi:hypothetical protein